MRSIVSVFVLTTMTICYPLLGQKSKETLVYSPVTNTSIEESFPVAYSILKQLKCDIEDFNYGEGILKSTYYEYYRGLSRCIGKFNISIDQSGNLNVKIVDVMKWDKTISEWLPAGESLLSKAEYKYEAGFTEDIRNNIKNIELVNQLRVSFYNSLTINAKFYEHATELAGQRWFESNLKDKPVSWELTFLDIDKNSNGTYQFVEKYSMVTNQNLAGTATTKFVISMFTSADRNVLTSKGKKMIVDGFCRNLVYKDGVFEIDLTEKLDSPMPVNSLQAKVSESNTSVVDKHEQLKKLKELLDMGAITKEEFEKEKKKILGN